jgi:hypothetical protein
MRDEDHQNGTARSDADEGARQRAVHAQRPTSDNPWHAPLHDSMFVQPYPVFMFADKAMPGASLWGGTRLWTKAFREAGLTRGQRVVMALEASPAFVMVVASALWEGLSLFVVPTSEGAQGASLLEELDARVLVCDHGVIANGADGDGRLVSPDGDSRPPECGLIAGDCSGIERVDEAGAVSFRRPAGMGLPGADGDTGGDTGDAWMTMRSAVLLDTSVRTARTMAYRKGTVVSALPWHRPMGFFCDMMAALLGEGQVIRDASGGRDAMSIARCALEWNAEHVSLLARHAAAIAEVDGGAEFLRSLSGGAIGGGPVGEDLAAVLAGSRLRAALDEFDGAGGMILGEAGDWGEAVRSRLARGHAIGDDQASGPSKTQEVRPMRDVA